MIRPKMLFSLVIALCLLLTPLFSLLSPPLYGQWLETTITVESYPSDLIWNSQNNKVYCSNFNDNSVTVIDGQTDSVITTITVGSWPRAFCWNSIQNRIYVANYLSATVSVIRDSIISGIEENYQPLSTDRLMFEVYPNPAKTYFAIRLPQTLKQVQGDKIVVKIYDV